ncbi:MAG: beta-lactamase family protein [Gammaproteobacteria bacterium]|nr:beta-lactamase family protein [Gammaproteobacteria bacterium]
MIRCAPAILALLMLPTALRGAVVPAADPVALGFSPARLMRLDRFLRSEVSAGRKAGVVVLLARHGQVAWLKAYGVSDLASARPLGTDAMFRLFSMTKPVTTVALLTLYEQGRFALTDPLDRYLPAFSHMQVFDGVDAEGHLKLVPARRKITLLDVLRHTAGFTYGYFGDSPIERGYSAAGVDYRQADSLRQLVERLARQPLLYQPGEHWEYSFAHDVQAYLVEVLTGESFEAYCARVIFGPLGMHDTVFGIPADRAARFATLYAPREDGSLKALRGEEDWQQHFTRRPFGGVGLASTAADYLRFAQMLLNGGSLHGVRILGRKTVELMSADALPAAVSTWQEGIRYGLGLGVLTAPTIAGVAGSPGELYWPGIATTWMGIDRREDLIALLFTQYTPKDERFVEQFQALVYQSLD